MNAPTTWTSPEHRKSVLWVVTLAAIAIVFDGYDLVVYGTVLPTLLDDPSQLGELSPGTAGALGSYALIGMMIGAFIAGTFEDPVIALGANGKAEVAVGPLFGAAAAAGSWRSDGGE